MKKLLLLVLLTSMFGTAHATRSRMNSLGQPVDLGSFYIMDNRNFFRNPANAAKMRNFAVLELATDYTDDESTIVNVDGNMEGGYFGEFNSDMTYGVYLGKRSSLIDLTATARANPVPAAGTETYLTSANANPLNLFLGGGSDMKWGVNLNFAMTDNESAAGDQSFDALGLAVGIETSGGLQVYAQYSTAKTEGANVATGATTTTFEAGNEIESAPMMIGVIYGLNAETTIWAQYSGGDINVTTGTGETKNDFNAAVVGIGRIYELSPTARFNFDLSYNWGESDTAGGTVKTSALPIALGVETDATEWLILRGSVAQNFILGDTEDPSGFSSNLGLTGTRVALGATLHFGKLKVDGNLGGFGGGEESALFSSDNFFVNAAATYMF